MNFMKLYIGDYQRDTGHLSIAEHGAYLLMLQHYYATEKPLPTGKALHRLLRAETKADRDAIDAIAAQFWTLTDAGLVNQRGAEEIQKADHQRTVNREVGKRGGRPKQTEAITESVSESVSEPEPNRNPNQTPDTRQKIKAPRKVAVSLPDGFTPSPAVAAWYQEKGYSEPLASHLEHFIGYARAKGAKYVDWDQALMNAIRDDWAKVRTAKPMPIKRVADPTMGYR